MDSLVQVRVQQQQQLQAEVEVEVEAEAAVNRIYSAEELTTENILTA